MIRIPLPHNVPLKFYPPLRQHADRYLRESAYLGAGQGGTRAARRAKALARAAQRAATATRQP